MQISSQFRKPSSALKQTHPKYITSPPCVPIGCTRQGGGLITLIRDITFTTTDIPSIINTHNTKVQMVKIHINNTKHITIANMYIPLWDSISTHYKTADTDIQHCIQYITNIPHSVLTRYVNAQSTLWHSYTDDHRRQLIADVISNSDHITVNTNTPTRVPNTTLQRTSSLYITTVSNTLYNRTSWTTQHALSSDHLPIITTINIRHDYNKNRRTFTNYKKADWTQFTEDTESAFAQTNIHTAIIIFFKHHTDGRQSQPTKGQDARQLQALTRPHSMQNHTNKRYKENKHL